MKQHVLLLQGICELKTHPKKLLGEEKDISLEALLENFNEDKDGDIVDMTIKENGNVYIKSHIVYSMSNGDENVQFFENDETMDNTVIGIIHSVQNKVIKLK